MRILNKTEWVKRLLAASRWLLIGVIFFYILRMLIVNWEKIQHSPVAFKPGLLTLSMIILCLHLFTAATLWHMLTLFNRIGINFLATLTAWFYSLFGKYVPGKVFLWAGRIYYYKRQVRSIKKTTFCFTLEMLFQMFASFLIISMALGISRHNLFSGYQSSIILLTLFLGMMINPKIMELILNIFLRSLKKESVTIDMSYCNTLSLLAGYFLNALVLGGAFYLFVKSFYPVSLNQFLFLTSSFLLAGWIGILSIMAPGGLGVRDGVLLIALQLIMPEACAAVVVLGARLWTTGGELICVGLIYAFRKLISHG